MCCRVQQISSAMDPASRGVLVGGASCLSSTLRNAESQQMNFPRQVLPDIRLWGFSW